MRPSLDLLISANHLFVGAVLAGPPASPTPVAARLAKRVRNDEKSLVLLSGGTSTNFRRSGVACLASRQREIFSPPLEPPRSDLDRPSASLPERSDELAPMRGCPTSPRPDARCHCHFFCLPRPLLQKILRICELPHIGAAKSMGAPISPSSTRPAGMQMRAWMVGIAVARPSFQCPWSTWWQSAMGTIGATNDLE